MQPTSKICLDAGVLAGRDLVAVVRLVDDEALHAADPRMAMPRARQAASWQ
jgi:hypothetical protein